jgi:hypothetical protein
LTSLVCAEKITLSDLPEEAFFRRFILKMFKLSPARLPLALVCTGLLALSACGSGQSQADRNAKDVLDQAQAQRAQAAGLDDLAAIQKSYDDLAGNPDISKQMQIVVRGRQAQLRQERISMMVAELRSEELAIGRDIEDIRQLAMQVSSAESSVDALKSYDPATQTDKLKSQAAAVQGSADQLTWSMPNPTTADPNGSVSLPTIFGAKQEIDSLTAKIQQNQSDTAAAHQLSSAKGDEAAARRVRLAISSLPMPRSPPTTAAMPPWPIPRPPRSPTTCSGCRPIATDPSSRKRISKPR